MLEIYRVGEERARHRCHGDNRKPEYMLSMGDGVGSENNKRFDAYPLQAFATESVINR